MRYQPRMSFQKILDKYRKIAFSERDKGDRFERLMQAYLQTYAQNFSSLNIRLCQLHLNGIILINPINDKKLKKSYFESITPIQRQCYPNHTQKNIIFAQNDLIISILGFKKIIWQNLYKTL